MFSTLTSAALTLALAVLPGCAEDDRGAELCQELNDAIDDCNAACEIEACKIDCQADCDAISDDDEEMMEWSNDDAYQDCEVARGMCAAVGA